MNEYKNKVVAVTGGNGFIGSRLAERLAFEEAANVNALIHTWNKSTWVSRADVDLILGDITRLDTLKPLLRDVEIVFHCATTGYPALCRPVNVEGTRNVLEACIKYGVKKIVHFSTIGVHGPTLHDGMNEDAPQKKFGNPYADSKLEAEQLFWRYVNAEDLEGVVIRPTYVWGPNSPWFTLQPVNDIINKKFLFVDDGHGACNAVHVDNVIDLALRAGLNSRAEGEAFLIRDPDRITWREFFENYAAIAQIDPAVLGSVTSKRNLKKDMIRDLDQLITKAYRSLTKNVEKYEGGWPLATRYGLKAPRKLFRMLSSSVKNFPSTPYSWWDIQKYSSPGHISIEKAKRLLDYRPRITVAEGMKATRDWLLAQNHIPNKNNPKNNLTC